MNKTFHIHISAYKIITVLLWIWILGYPFAESFFGIDLGDTGIHFCNFRYILSRPEIVGFSAIFTAMIGKIWLHFFSFLGLWGLNFLEVLIEWLLSLIIYRKIHPYFGKLTTLAGLSIATGISRCYLNIFNYHQFSVFLISIYLLLIFTANQKDSVKHSVFAGVFYVLSIFARVSSIICIFAVILYFYWYIYKKGSNFRMLLYHAFSYMGGVLLIGSIFYIILSISGLLPYFLTSVLKLNSMATAETGAYSLTTMLNNLLWQNFNTFSSAFILLGAVFLFGIALNFFIRYRTTFFNIIFGSVFSLVAVYLVKFSYDVNPVNGSPQFTTGPNFLFGILIFTSILMFAITHLGDFNKKEEYCMLYMISILLPVFITTGSSTGTKHIIISMYFLAPVFLFAMKQLWIHRFSIYTRITDWSSKTKDLENEYKKKVPTYLLLFLFFAVGIKYADTLYRTNNFDSIKRWKITETIDNADNLKYLHTTKREKDAIEEVTASLKNINPNSKLMVFGTGLGFYPITEREPFTRAWITDDSLPSAQFQEELHTRGAMEKPVIIYCKTNQYFGFDEENYAQLIKNVKHANYNGKKEILMNFLTKNQYSMIMENDYYCVFYPDKKSCTQKDLKKIFY